MSDTSSFVSSSEESTAVIREASLPPSTHSISGSREARARAVDPNNGRCLLENSPEHSIVDWVHYFPKRKAGRETLMTKLEYHWRMPRGSLNLDTRYNIFPVRPHLRRLFQQPKQSGSWILVPEQRIVEHYHAQLVYEDYRWQVSCQAFSAIDNGIFTYHFLSIDPQKHMVDLTITRQENHATQENPESSMQKPNCVVHVYPFESLPPIQSHLHPKFVILEAGRKLHGSFAVKHVDSLIKKHDILKRILEIYAAWIEPCTNRQFIRSKPSTKNDSAASETESLDSAKYTPPPYYRSIWQRRSARKFSSSRSSLRSGDGRRKRRRHSSNLSGRTLREHTMVAGKQGWDTKSLEEWRKQCQPIEDHQPWGDPAYEDVTDQWP